MIKIKTPVFNEAKWRVPFVIVLVAEMVTLIGFQTSISIIPFFLQEDLHITEDKLLKIWISVLSAFPSIALAIFSPIWGNMADRLGKRLMLLRAMFGGAVVIFLMTFVMNPGQLLALRFIQGCLTGSVAAATVLVVGLVPASSAGMALGLLQVGVYVGSALGPALGGFLFSTVGGRLNFMVTSLLLFTASMITFLFVPEPKKAEAEAEKVVVKPSMPAKKGKLIDLEPFKNSKTLLILVLITLFSQLAFNMNTAILGVFVQAITPSFSIKEAARITSFILAAGASAAAVGAISFGYLGKKIDFYITALVCVLGAIVMLIPQLLTSSWQFLLFLRFFYAFFIGGLMPSISVMLATNAQKEQQGAVFGFNAACAAIGVALGPALGGVVSTLRHGALGYRLTFGSSILTLSLLTFFVIKNRRHITSPKS